VITEALIHDSLRFLLRHQDADGAWRDFQTKPGRSDAWVTAYIGLKLSGIFHRLPELEHAARFLLSASRRDGWAYNSNCDPDADSTAHAILFLHRMRYSVKPSSFAALGRFQQACGGFATYRNLPQGHGWGYPHPDVTAVALQALQLGLGRHHDRIRQGLESLACQQHSYWWISAFYLPLQLLLLGSPSHAKEPGQNAPADGASIDDSRIRLAAQLFSLCAFENLSQPSGCFDQALALECAVLTRRPPTLVRSLMQSLAARRRDDGSWPSHPILRITHPGSRALNDQLFRASPVVPDDRGLFTTATVMAALTAANTYIEKETSQ
jgi:hypothetical protein